MSRRSWVHVACALLLAGALGCAPGACSAPPGAVAVAPSSTVGARSRNARRVSIQLLDVEGPYELRLLHESGRTLQQGPAAGCLHVVELPPGPCIASLRRPRADGTLDGVDHAFTVTEAPDQFVEWAVPAPK